MTLSCIIPTLDRPDDLRRALGSIAANATPPDEVLIVEQGDIDRTREIARAFEDRLAIQVIPLAEKSLTRARNLGVMESTGSLVMFMDDDVELEPDHVETLRAYLHTHTDVYGIVGRDLNNVGGGGGMSPGRTLISMLFCGASFFGPSRIRRSGSNILRNTADHEETVEWLSGCSFTVRRSVFDAGIRFNDRFIRWCLGEDAYFSYQVHKRYPSSLRYVPQLRFRHHSSQVARLTNLQIIRMTIIYKYIFWKKEVYAGSPLTLLCYLWHQIGRSVSDVLRTRSLAGIRAILETYAYLIRHFREIEQERIDYNDFILHGGRSA